MIRTRADAAIAGFDALKTIHASGGCLRRLQQIRGGCDQAGVGYGFVCFQMVHIGTGNFGVISLLSADRKFMGRGNYPRAGGVFGVAH